MSLEKRTVIFYGCAEPSHNRGCVTDHINAQIMTTLLKEGYGVESIDVIKIPGPDRLGRIFGEPDREFLGWRFKELCSAHNVVAVAVMGHSNCAGYPVSDEEHQRDVMESAHYIQGHYVNVPVFGFFGHPVEGDQCHLNYLGMVTHLERMTA